MTEDSSLGHKKVEFLRQHRDFFVGVLQRCHPLDPEILAEYADKWDWGKLSGNEELPWTAELIERYEDRWSWGGLSNNAGVPWSAELISRYEEQWNWKTLSGNEALPWSGDLIERYDQKWDWEALSENESLPWSEELVDRYSDRWDWEVLSGNGALPWSDYFIGCFADRWKWEGPSFVTPSLSDSDHLPWTEDLLDSYSDRWDWDELSGNETLSWTQNLLERYEDRWDWDELSGNEALPWTQSLLERYEDRWNWTELSGNRALPWSEELIEDYAERWKWSWLSGNPELPWTEELIEEYSNKWDWRQYTRCLSQNPSLPWSEELIARCAHLWDWSLLGGNEGLPWSSDLIDRFSERWEFDFEMVLNDEIPWSEDLLIRYADHWGWTKPVEEPVEGEGNVTNLTCEWDGIDQCDDLPWTLDFLEKSAHKVHSWYWLANKNQGVYRALSAHVTPELIHRVLDEQDGKEATSRDDASQESPSSGAVSEKSDGSEERTHSDLAEERLDLCIESMALVAHYVGGLDGHFDEDEREEASNSRVLQANLDKLLYSGNPDDEAAIEAVEEELTREDGDKRLRNAIEDIEDKDLDSDDLMDRIESMSEEAEELNGFLPLEISGDSDEERRRKIAEHAERYDLDVDVEAYEDIDNLYEAFDEAIKDALGDPFNINLAYALVHYGTYIGYASGSLFSSSPYSDQEEEAVQDVGLTYGLPAFDLVGAKMQAEMGAEAIESLTSDSFMDKLRDAVGL